MNFYIISKFLLSNDVIIVLEMNNKFLCNEDLVPVNSLCHDVQCSSTVMALKDEGTF